MGYSIRGATEKSTKILLFVGTSASLQPEGHRFDSLNEHCFRTNEKAVWLPSLISSTAVPLSETPLPDCWQDGRGIGLGSLGLCSFSCSRGRELSLWTLTKSPFVVRSMFMLNASEVLCSQRRVTARIIWNKLRVVPFRLFVLIALNCAGSYRSFQIPPVMYCLWHRASGRQDDGLSPSVFFSQSILKERNRSGTQRWEEQGKITKLDFLYCALMLWCVVFPGPLWFMLKSKLTRWKQIHE